MDIRNIKLIDLNHSKWDKEKSDPKTGQYVWEDRKEVDLYNKEGRRPAHMLHWVRNAPLNTDKWRYGLAVAWTFVDAGIDPYHAEPADIQNGHYIFRDMVLMKCSLLDYLMNEKYNQERGSLAAHEHRQAFKEYMKAQGAGVPEDFLAEQEGRAAEDMKKKTDELLDTYRKNQQKGTVR